MSFSYSVPLQEKIEQAAEMLPDGWKIKIEVEKGSGSVVVYRPDGTSVCVDDGESDIPESFTDAMRLIRDEIASDKMIKEDKIVR